MKCVRLFAIVMGMCACLAQMACSPSQRGYSGFLGDYSQLKPSEKVEGAMSYRKPGLDLSKYNQFIIDPIGVHFAPDASGSAVDPATLAELTDYFRSKLVTELSKNYRVVQNAGPNTMRLRIAVTDLKKTIKSMNIHIATKLSGVGLGAAAVEAEGVDAESGDRLFAFVHTRPGDRLAIVEGLQDWAHAKQAMDFWVEQLVARLDEAHGVKSK